MHFFTVFFPNEDENTPLEYYDEFKSNLKALCFENNFEHIEKSNEMIEVQHSNKKNCIDFKIYCGKLNQQLWKNLDPNTARIFLSNVEFKTEYIPNFKRKFGEENPELNTRKQVHFEKTRGSNLIQNRRKSLYERPQQQSEKLQNVKFTSQKSSTFTSSSFPKPAFTSNNYSTPQTFNIKPHYQPLQTTQYSPKYAEASTTNFPNFKATGIIKNQFPDLIQPTSQPTQVESRSESIESKITISYSNYNANISTFFRHILSFVYGLKTIRNSENSDKITKQLSFVNPTMAACFYEKIQNYNYSNEDFNLTDLQIIRQPNVTITKIQKIVGSNIETIFD